MEFVTEIIEIKDETFDVKTFRFNRPNNFDFIAGQYCLLSFIESEEFKGDSRPFTFSSSPNQKNFFDITIKKMGAFTTKIFNLKVNDKIQIDGPKGETLNFNELNKNKIIFLAGGSGITPFKSILELVIDKKLSNKIYLFYSNKTRADIIFLERLNQIDYNNDNIKVINTITTDTCIGEIKENKRIDYDMITRYVDNPSEYIFYLCGPPIMVTSLFEELKSNGISEDKILFEAWQIKGKHDK